MQHLQQDIVKDGISVPANIRNLCLKIVLFAHGTVLNACADAITGSYT